MSSSTFAETSMGPAEATTPSLTTLGQFHVNGIALGGRSSIGTDSVAAPRCSNDALAASRPVSASCFFAGRVGDEAVGHAQADNGLRGEAVSDSKFQNRGAETVLKGMVFNRDDGMPRLKGAGEHFAIDGFAEPSVNDAHGDAVGGEFFGCEHRLLGERPIGDDGGVVAFAKSAALADFPHLRSRRAQIFVDGVFEVGGRDVVARVAEELLGGLEGESARRSERFNSAFVAGGHENDAGKRAKERLIGKAVVDSAVVTDESRAVHAEDDRLAVENDFLPDLIEAALGESGIHRRERAEARLAHARGHCREMALAYTRVDIAFGVGLLELAESRSIGHGGGQGHDARIGIGRA